MAARNRVMNKTKPNAGFWLSSETNFYLIVNFLQAEATKVLPHE